MKSNYYKRRRKHLNNKNKYIKYAELKKLKYKKQTINKRNKPKNINNSNLIISKQFIHRNIIIK